MRVKSLVTEWDVVEGNTYIVSTKFEGDYGNPTGLFIIDDKGEPWFLDNIQYEVVDEPFAESL